MKSVMNWSKHHTLATVAILGVVGYVIYKKYGKQSSATGSMTNFTGRAGMHDEFVRRGYSNASGNEPMRNC